MSDHFDAIVLGAGPAGETAVSRLTSHGLRTALVERELIGGECAYWACIPSKTLLRAPEVRSEAKRAAGVSTPEQRWESLAAYRDYMIRGLDDGGQLREYEEQGIPVYKGAASLAGPGKVHVNGETLSTERIIVATGSSPKIPPIPGLAEAGYWTNREATTFGRVPDSAVVLGGGPVGIELAQMLRRLGADIHLVESDDRLLAREDPRVGELIADALASDGVDARLGHDAIAATRSDGARVVRLEDGLELQGRELIVATGRDPATAGLALERVGIDDGDAGIEIDERCRAAEGVWAIGDVTGAMPFTHVAKYQAQIACADILGERAAADLRAVPRVVFCDPEVAAVGVTEGEARAAGVDIAVARVELPSAVARPWTYEQEPRGELALIADRNSGRLIGAWIVAPLASEWIHYATLAIKARIPLSVLRDTVLQFPTYTEAYLKAVEQIVGA